jgi:hypothetical protein
VREGDGGCRDLSVSDDTTDVRAIDWYTAKLSFLVPFVTKLLPTRHDQPAVLDQHRGKEDKKQIVWAKSFGRLHSSIAVLLGISGVSRGAREILKLQSRIELGILC